MTLCRELESWILGDLDALATAYQAPRISEQKSTRKFRSPDELGNPSEELRKLVPAYQKVAGARRVAAHVDPDRNSSRSFRAFVAALRRLAAEEAATP